MISFMRKDYRKVTCIRRIIRVVIGYSSVVLLITACNAPDQSSNPEYLQYFTTVRELLKIELGDDYELAVPPATVLQLDRGKEIYMRLCASCHGVEGRGDGMFGVNLPRSPSDFTDSKQSTFFSEQGRIQIIRKGIKGSPMIGWEKVLNNDDILAVYIFTRSLAKP